MMAQHQHVLRFANFLSPVLYPTYARIIEALSQTTGLAASLETGENPEDFAEGHLAGGFICGLLYVHLSARTPNAVELSAAPVLSGQRYQQKPRYFSDIVVHRDSPYTCLADLAGCTWAYNEAGSHSGYNLVLYSLFQQGLSPAFFSTWRPSGSHARSLDQVAHGEADATALDSHVLSALLRANPSLASRVRCIGTFGPSAVPPFIVSKHLDLQTRQTIQAALIAMSDDPAYVTDLKHGFIERFVPVTDTHYDDIRQMYASVQAQIQVAPC